MGNNILLLFTTIEKYEKYDNTASLSTSDTRRPATRHPNSTILGSLKILFLYL
jgi:hypothetical protein